jgi:hypothetical protein
MPEVKFYKYENVFCKNSDDAVSLFDLAKKLEKCLSVICEKDEKILALEKDLNTLKEKQTSQNEDQDISEDQPQLFTGLFNYFDYNDVSVSSKQDLIKYFLDYPGTSDLVRRAIANTRKLFDGVISLHISEEEPKHFDFVLGYANEPEDEICEIIDHLRDIVSLPLNDAAFIHVSAELMDNLIKLSLITSDIYSNTDVTIPGALNMINLIDDVEVFKYDEVCKYIMINPKVLKPLVEIIYKAKEIYDGEISISSWSDDENEHIDVSIGSLGSKDKDEIKKVVKILTDLCDNYEYDDDGFIHIMNGTGEEE